MGQQLDLGGGYYFHLGENGKIDSIFHNGKQLFTIEQLIAITKWTDFLTGIREHEVASGFGDMFDTFFKKKGKDK